MLKEASSRLDGDVAAERSRYRALLADVLDDLTALQSQSEKIARRVSDALDELEGAPEIESDISSIAPPGLAAEAPPEAAAVVKAAAASTRAKPETPRAEMPIEAPPTEPKSGSAQPDTETVSAAPPSRSASTTLLVHGVPRASAALGLKSYIEKLDFVASVEPREFAGGLLRLQVDGARPFALGDLSGWNMSDRMQLRSASNDLLEVDLVPA